MKIGDLLDGEFLTDSLIIISHTLKRDKAWVLSHLDDVVSDDLAKKIQQLVAKRKSGYPLHYITRCREFMGLEFYIEEGVFIPRPETETLVQLAIDYIRNNNIRNVAEIGCGSGVISITIAYYLKIKVYATDLSKKAIEITRKNAKKLSVEAFIEAKRGNFLEPFKKEFSDIDLVVSNPPYVEPEYKLPKESEYEPKEAFFYGKSSLDFYKEFSKRYRGMGWTVIMEFSGKDSDKKEIKKLFHDVNFIEDLDGIERFFIGRV